MYMRKKMEEDAMETSGDTTEETESPWVWTDEEKLVGTPRPGLGKWASCLRIFDATQNKTLDLHYLSDNEAAFSICTCVFHDREGEVFLVVGTGKDVRLQPKSASAGYIHVYRLVEGRQFQLLHKTQIDIVPSALCPFQGRLLVGAGKSLKIYDIGKKKSVEEMRE